VFDKNEKLNSADDSDLVDLCKKELPYITDSYEVLVKRYEAIVFRFCFAYLRYNSDAEEVTQDVFLRVFHHIKKFEKRSAFKTWLMRIAQNQCSRRYHKIKRRIELLERFKQEPTVTDDSEEISTDMSEGLAMRALQQLDKDTREILSLRHLSELPLKEVAIILGLSPSAAKMRHHRAIKKFREAYERNQQV